jgi:hypothetical protein
MISTSTTAKGPETANFNFTTSNSDQQSFPLDFHSFYDKYAPAFYGEIKRRLLKDDISQQVLIEVFKKLYQSGEFVNAKHEKVFITALKLVRKEISQQKVNLVLNQLFDKHTQKRSR